MAKSITGNGDDPVQEEILRAALQLYRKFGTKSITMDDLAAATGRSRSSLYYYFKSHEEIFYAVVDIIVKDVAAEIRQAVDKSGRLRDRLYIFCTAKLKTSGHWKPVFTAMWASMNAEEQSKHTKAMSVLHKKLVHQESMILKEIVAAAIAKQEIRPITVTEQDMLSFIVSGGIRGIRDEINYHNDPHDIKEAMGMLADMIGSWLTP